MPERLKIQWAIGNARLPRVLLAAMALVVLTATSPAAVVGTEGCAACEQCHPSMNCIECGVLVSFTIDACCGNFVDGTAFCYSAINGFAVACEGGGGCVCDDEGGNCEPLIEG